VSGTFFVNAGDKISMFVDIYDDKCYCTAAGASFTYPIRENVVPHEAIRSATAGPFSGTVNKNESPKLMGTIQAQPQPQQGGTVSNVSYMVTDNNPNVETYVFGNQVYAKTDQTKVETVQWSSMKSGNATINDVPEAQTVIMSDLVAPNGDTSWTVVDDNDLVRTWMSGRTVYAAFVGHIDGDYNANGVVDAADYAFWRDAVGATVPPFTGADGSGNGTVDQADYDVWRANFGRMATPVVAAAAEELLPYENVRTDRAAVARGVSNQGDIGVHGGSKAMIDPVDASFPLNTRSNKSTTIRQRANYQQHWRLDVLSVRDALIASPLKPQAQSQASHCHIAGHLKANNDALPYYGGDNADQTIDAAFEFFGANERIYLTVDG
jgi:hypothetical protein